MELGNNILVYTTQPVTRETAIFGQPSVRLFAATSASNADFTTKLVRVTAAGRAEFLSIGIARGSWLFRGKTYAADTIHEWVFTLEPLSVVLAVGEQLRVEIASSAFPLYDRNPSTAIEPQRAGEWTWSRSTQQVFHSARYPSALQLPVTGDAGW
jgi:hypothetical protein